MYEVTRLALIYVSAVFPVQSHLYAKHPSFYSVAVIRLDKKSILSDPQSFTFGLDHRERRLVAVYVDLFYVLPFPPR